MKPYNSELGHLQVVHEYERLKSHGLYEPYHSVKVSKRAFTSRIRAYILVAFELTLMVMLLIACIQYPRIVLV